MLHPWFTLSLLKVSSLMTKFIYLFVKKVNGTRFKIVAVKRTPQSSWILFSLLSLCIFAAFFIRLVCNYCSSLSVRRVTVDTLLSSEKGLSLRSLCLSNHIVRIFLFLIDSCALISTALPQLSSWINPFSIFLFLLPTLPVVINVFVLCILFFCSCFVFVIIQWTIDEQRISRRVVKPSFRPVLGQRVASFTPLSTNHVSNGNVNHFLFTCW